MRAPPRVAARSSTRVRASAPARSATSASGTGNPVQPSSGQWAAVSQNSSGRSGSRVVGPISPMSAKRAICSWVAATLRPMARAVDRDRTAWSGWTSAASATSRPTGVHGLPPPFTSRWPATADGPVPNGDSMRRPTVHSRRWPRRSSQPHPARRRTARPGSLMRSATTMAGRRAGASPTNRVRSAGVGWARGTRLSTWRVPSTVRMPSTSRTSSPSSRRASPTSRPRSTYSCDCAVTNTEHTVRHLVSVPQPRCTGRHEHRTPTSGRLRPPTCQTAKGPGPNGSAKGSGATTAASGST